MHQKKLPISNSGTATSFLALFISVPSPVCLATRSVSGGAFTLPLSSIEVSVASLPFFGKGGSGTGVAGRVGGKEGISISMSNDCRRINCIDVLRIVGEGGGLLRDADPSLFRSRVGDVDGFLLSSLNSSKRSSKASVRSSSALVG